MLCSSRHHKNKSNKKRNLQATVTVAENQDIGHAIVQNLKEKSHRYVLYYNILTKKAPLPMNRIFRKICR